MQPPRFRGVVRIPRRPRPGGLAAYRFTLLPLSQRYILMELLPPLVVGLAVFALALLVQTLFSRMIVVLGADLGAGTMLRLIACLLPAMLANTAPMALLLSVLVVYGRLSEDREVVAMTAGGISYRHLAQPALMLGLAFWLLSMYFVHELAPRALVIQQHIAKAALQRIAQTAVHEGFNSHGGVDIYVRRSEDMMLYDITLIQQAEAAREVGPPERINTIATAPRGELDYQPGTSVSMLRLYEGSMMFPIGGDGRVEIDFGALELRVDLSRGVRDLMHRMGRDRAMTTPVLRRAIEEMHARPELSRQEQRSLWRMESTLGERRALPASCLVFAMLAAPLGLWTGFAKKWKAFLAALAISFLYMVLQAGFDDLARDGAMNATVASWVPNLAFGLVAVTLNVLVARR